MAFASMAVPALLLLLQPSEAPEVRSTAADRTELGLTLYHGGYAMVRERRRFELPAGPVRLALEEVAATIEPKTVQFRTVDGPSVRILERNFEFNLLSPENLTLNSLNGKVRILDPAGDLPPIEGSLASLPTQALHAPPRTPMEARLDPMPPLWRLARIYRGRFAKRLLVDRDPNVLVRLLGGYTAVSPADLAFVQRPPGLRPSPTLLMDLEASAHGSRSVDVAYLAKGLTWQATYVATLNRAGTALDLDAFVTLTNESGTHFPRAHLQLLAGDPARVPDPPPEPGDPDLPRLNTTAVMVAASAHSFSTERIGDNQLFSLGRPTSLEPGQTKQIALFSAAAIPLHARNILGVSLPDRLPDVAARGEADPQSDWAPCDIQQTRFEFINHTSHGLGRPLPRGQVFVYYTGPDGHPIPLFDEAIEEAAEGEKAELSLGPMAGLTGTWRWSRIERGTWFQRRSRFASFEVQLRNDRSGTVPVEVHALVGADWQVQSTTHPGTRERSDLVVFRFPAAVGPSLLRATFRVPDPVP